MSRGKQFSAKDAVKKAYKEVELSGKDLINANQPLQQLAMNEFPVLVAFKISTTLKKLDTVTEDFSTRRKVILDELGTLGEKGVYTFEGEKEKEAEDRVSTLLDEKVKLQILPLTLGELGKLNLAPRILALLDWYIVE